MGMMGMKKMPSYVGPDVDSKKNPITRQDFESVVELIDILLKKSGIDIDFEKYRNMNVNEKISLLRDIKIDSIIPYIIDVNIAGSINSHSRLGKYS